MYRVFLGAPLLSELQNDPSSYSWRTTSSTSAGSMKTQSTSKNPIQLQSTQSISNLLPLSTLEAASYRISLIYKDIVFGDEPDEETLESLSMDLEELELNISGSGNSVQDGEKTTNDLVQVSLVQGVAVQDNSDQNAYAPGNNSVQDGENTTNDLVQASLVQGVAVQNVSDQNAHASQNTNETRGLEVSVFRGLEQTTLIPWDPTRFDDTGAGETSRGSSAALSFLLDTSSSEVSNSHLQSQAPQGKETQAVESQFVESQSLGNYSEASSIGRFPSFHFNLHSLTSLSQLAGPAGRAFKGSRKVNVLLAVLEVEGPDVIRIKKGADAGKSVGIFKMILGDEEGNVCKLTAWREVAEEWGGIGKGVAAIRGDIVHIENVMATCDPAASTTMTASPYLKSQLVICYRTMPYTHEDGRLRPDLRLGHSEPAVRKVAAAVRWFETMSGLAR